MIHNEWLCIFQTVSASESNMYPCHKKDKLWMSSCYPFNNTSHFFPNLKVIAKSKKKKNQNQKNLVNTGADYQKNLKHHLEPWKSAPSKKVSGTTALKGRTLTVWLACCIQVLIDLCEVWHLEITSHLLYFLHTTMSTNSFHWQTVYTAKWPWTLPLSPY